MTRELNKEYRIQLRVLREVWNEMWLAGEVMFKNDTWYTSECCPKCETRTFDYGQDLEYTESNGRQIISKHSWFCPRCMAWFTAEEELWEPATAE